MPLQKKKPAAKPAAQQLPKGIPVFESENADVYEIVQAPVDIFSMFRPKYSGDKMYYMIFNSVPAINQKYYFNAYPEIDREKIIGIEFLPGGVISPVTINGVTYNILLTPDAAKVQVSLYDKQNQPILYRTPLNALGKFSTGVGALFELRDYSKIEISTGNSFIELVDNVFATAFPLAIPLRFIY